MWISRSENLIMMIKIVILDRIFTDNLVTSCPFGYRYPVHPRREYLLYLQLFQGG